MINLGLQEESEQNMLDENEYLLQRGNMIIKSNRLYKSKELSDILKEYGIAHSRGSIRGFVKRGILRCGKLPNGYNTYLGGDIVDFLAKHLDNILYPEEKL